MTIFETEVVRNSKVILILKHILIVESTQYVTVLDMNTDAQVDV